jgi:asparagine synthase (glutamine-hydrolysing)
MCGISGIIDKSNMAVKMSAIKAMNDLIAHRGPDDEGFYFDRNISFGHRRLSILDLSEAGHQPMHFLEKYVITYNGEIYNYIEIRDELIKSGYQFKSETDTEVILAAYDCWGEECVVRFNGMWSFAIYDSLKQKVFCSRDRFGVKPFYYSNLEDHFVFGSEIKQLLLFQEENIANQKILVDYLLYGLEEHSNETFFDGILKLEQSHNLIYCLKTNRYEIKKYFDINLDPALDKLHEKEAVSLIKESLRDSIKLRLRSDVKVGTCLSGGLDSSSIAAIASEEHLKYSDEPFMAIHAKSIEEKTDESYFANMVAEHCGLNLIQVEPSLEQIAELVDEVVYTQEEPFGGLSIFMQYLVMRSARENNCVVLLDGQGGDETLFGYEGYYSFYFASLLSKFKFLSYVLKIKNLKPYKLTKKRLVRDSIAILFRNKLQFIESLIRKKRTFVKVEHSRKELNHIYSFLSFKDFQKREIMLRNLPHLLRYEDKNSMRNSVETRLPFIDYRFVQNALSISESVKFKLGFLKYVLRKAVSSILPNDVVWRINKFGFEAPADMWIEQHKNEMIVSIEGSKLVNKLIQLDGSLYTNRQMLWKLYNVSVWERVYEVKP